LKHKIFSTTYAWTRFFPIVKEEDERLKWFNRFVSPPPKKNTAQQKGKKP